MQQRTYNALGKEAQHGVMKGCTLHARIRIASGKRAICNLEPAQLTSASINSQVCRLGLETPEQLGPSVRETGTMLCSRPVVSTPFAGNEPLISSSQAHLPIPSWPYPDCRHSGISRRGTDTRAHVLTLKHISALL